MQIARKNSLKDSRAVLLVLIWLIDRQTVRDFKLWEATTFKNWYLVFWFRFWFRFLVCPCGLRDLWRPFTSALTIISWILMWITTTTLLRPVWPNAQLGPQDCSRRSTSSGQDWRFNKLINKIFRNEIDQWMPLM